MDNDNIIGYIQYSIYKKNAGNAASKLQNNLNNKSINYINIDSIEIKPSFRGKKLCYNLINELLIMYKNIKEYKLLNLGGIISYKCYKSVFTHNNFSINLLPGHDRNYNNPRNPRILNKSNLNKIIKDINETKTKKLNMTKNNNKKKNELFNGFIQFIKKI